MTVELNNGTKMSLNTNDVKEITFIDGKLVVTGGSLMERLDSLAKVHAFDYDFLVRTIENMAYWEGKDKEELLERIKQLENRIDSLVSSQGGSNNQGSTLSTDIIGTWYVDGHDKHDKHTEMTFEKDMTFTWREYDITGNDLLDWDSGTYRIVEDLLYTTWEKYSARPRKFRIEGNHLITDEAGGTTWTKK